MDPKDIRTQLRRVQEDLKRFKRLLEDIEAVDWVRTRRSYCPKCRTKEFQILVLRVAVFTLTDETGQPGKDKFHFEIIDGCCKSCGLDAGIWRILTLADTTRDPKLARYKARIRITACHNPTCRESSVLGVWRWRTCTGSICMSCKQLILPASLAKLHADNLRFLEDVQLDLDAREALLEAMCDES